MLYFPSPFYPAMKLPPAAVPGVGSRFMAVLVMLSFLVVHISAMKDTLKEPRREDKPKLNGIPFDGAEAAEKQFLLHRERSDAGNNSVPSLPNIAKQLQAIEQSYASFAAMHNKTASLMNKQLPARTGKELWKCINIQPILRATFRRTNILKNKHTI